MSGIFLVLIIKSVRWPSLWRECFWENTLQNRWDTHKSQQFSSSRFPGITNIISPVLFSTALDSHLFSPTFPNFIPCAHHYSTYCQTIAERLRPVRYFKNKIFPWPCCPCRSQLHFSIITQTQTRHFFLTVFTRQIPEALQFNFNKNITPWTHMWTSFRFGDFDTQRM